MIRGSPAMLVSRICLPRMRGDDPGPPAYDAIMLVFAPHARG